MAKTTKKKGSSKRTTVRRKKSAATGRKPASSARARRGKKIASKTASKTASKRTSKKETSSKKPARKKATRPPVMRRARSSEGSSPRRSATRGLGPEAGGQSGDTEGISRVELADSESVEELLEEGQAFEAGVVSGVENAPDADKGEVRTRQVPEDDVPQEYLDED